MTEQRDTEAPIWLFDAHCVLCSRAVRYTLRHERKPRIRFVAIRSAEGRRIAQRHGVDPEDPQTFLFIEDGRALSKSDGVLALMGHLSGPARLLAPSKLIPRPIRNWLYDLVASNRYRLFGRLSTCEFPDPAQHHRFVLPES